MILKPQIETPDKTKGKISVSTEGVTGKMNEVLTCIMYSGEHGISIRDISHVCDLSVYATRNWVIKLELMGLIYSDNQLRNKKWFESNNIES